MICQHCGKKLESHNFFCTHCGERLVSEDEIPTIAAAMPETIATSTLDPIADKMLRFFGKHYDKKLCKDDLIRNMDGDPNTVIYYFDDLNDNGYIESRGFTRGQPVPYELTKKGRKYLIDNPENAN